MKNPQYTEGWTEEIFWNMILFTQNVITERCCYNIKYWPSLGMAMIRANTEEEDDWNTSKRRAWAAPGYEGIL
eukprot:532180-Heterocapsa_arctica.AAC.1